MLSVPFCYGNTIIFVCHGDDSCGSKLSGLRPGLDIKDSKGPL